MRILHYDCFAGISGDMHLAALLDLGVPHDYLRAELAKLALPGFELEISAAIKSGIAGTRVDVITADAPQHHGEQHSQGHTSPHHRGPHNHGHPQHDEIESSDDPLVENRHVHTPHHAHRNLADIRGIIEGSSLSAAVKELSLKMFLVIAEAEATIHGKSLADIHFHEVGAVDSIVDIVGAAIGIAWLAPDRISATPPELGSGTVRCAHGILPVPAPATALILRGLPVRMGGTDIEATTPTGAAILKALVQDFTTVCAFTPQRIGFGIGHAEGRLPNLLRVFLAEAEEEGAPVASAESFVELAANIDDMSPEMLAPAIARLIEAGALDAWLVPIVMKKGRAAFSLCALSTAATADVLERVFFSETSTLGVRRTAINRSSLPRESLTIVSPLGMVAAKKSVFEGRIRIKAEFDDLLRIARERDLPLPEVQRIVQNAIADSDSFSPRNPA